MFSLLTNFTPLKWLKVGLFVATLIAVWYGVDSFAFKPLRECKANTKEQLSVRDVALNEAGETISGLVSELQSYRADAKAKRLEGVYSEISKKEGDDYEEFNVSSFDLYNYSF